jgi:hypothetical protein
MNTGMYGATLQYWMPKLIKHYKEDRIGRREKILLILLGLALLWIVLQLIFSVGYYSP